MESLARKHVGALQSTFVTALREPSLPVPEGILAPEREQRTRRFNVYRNSVHASLTAALAARFPVVARLVGDEYFRALAREFIDRSPPSSPILAKFGEEFPAFLAGFEPIKDVPYVPDVARLEWARSAAYHARDATVIGIEVLSGLDAANLSSVTLIVHPSVCVVQSAFPIVSVWMTNTHDAEVKPVDIEGGGETALVSRPHLDVLVTPISCGAARLFDVLSNGLGLGAAFEVMGAEAAEFQVGQSLAELFVSGAFCGISSAG